MTTEQGVQGTPQIHGLQSTLSELRQLCKARHHLIYHTLRPLLICVCHARHVLNARPRPN